MSDQNHRMLWTAVVLQSIGDIENTPYHSLEYDDAVAFFTHAGAWGDSRQAIADCLDMHPDDLTRFGKAAIAARHLKDGPPQPIVPRTPRQSLVPTEPRAGWKKPINVDRAPRWDLIPSIGFRRRAA